MNNPRGPIERLSTIEAHFSASYRAQTGLQRPREVPDEFGATLDVLEFRSLSEEYLDAASRLSAAEVSQRLQVINAWAQLAGQAVELAMKSCIATRLDKVPRIHDLVELARELVDLGFDIGTDVMLATIVHLNHLYYRDLGSQARYPARYGGDSAAILPEQYHIDAVVTHFLGQGEVTVAR